MSICEVTMMPEDYINNAGVSTTYISCGCNSFSQAMDWGENNLICFATCNSVAVCEPFEEKGGKITSTCTAHKSKVNCVKWIRGHKDISEFVSCSFDNTATVWLVRSKENIVPVFTLIGHTSSIHSVDGRYDNGNTLIVTSSADHTVRLWIRFSGNRDEFVCFKVLNYTPSFIMSLNLLTMSKTEGVLLGLGMDAGRLEIYNINQTEVDYLANCDGHEDWIRSVDMKELMNGDILIATSSQDMSIRVMKLSQSKIEESRNCFHNEKPIYIKKRLYYLSVETVLFGHEGWVLSVNWAPGPEIELLTSSFDRTLVIWNPDSKTDLWMEKARMGELGGDNSIGYFGAKFGPSGDSVLAHSYQGSFQYWKNVKDGGWTASVIVSGHSDGVMDIDWERNGSYLLSVSLDKTTRLHVPQVKNGLELNWYEMSRPQIHGHSLNSIATLNNHVFASCAEEKVIRVFQPTHIVLKMLKVFSNISLNSELDIDSITPSSASIPALGLSNKASFKTLDESVVNEFPSVPPNEDYLIQNTLWPEMMKLYGHGYEVYSLASSYDGSKLATACKSSTAEHSKIILWDTKTWDIVDKLSGHQLTVTQMAFSPDDKKLLSVSRDRKWCVYQVNDSGSYSFLCSSGKTKVSHSRIIWTCSWSHDSRYFVTGSRDCKLIVWKDNEPVSVYSSSLGSITAADFAKEYVNQFNYLIAVGYDTGRLTLHSWNCSDGSWFLLYTLPELYGHCLTIQRIKFRPYIQVNKSSAVIQFASCSLDNSVRLFDVSLEYIKQRLK